MEEYKINLDKRNMVCQVCNVERSNHNETMTKACMVQFNKELELYPVLALFVMKPKSERK